MESITTDSKVKVAEAEAHEEKKVEVSGIEEEALDDHKDEVMKTDVKMKKAEAEPHKENRTVEDEDTAVAAAGPAIKTKNSKRKHAEIEGNTEEGGEWNDDIEKHVEETIDNVVRMSVEEIGETDSTSEMNDEAEAGFKEKALEEKNVTESNDDPMDEAIEAVVLKAREAAEVTGDVAKATAMEPEDCDIEEACLDRTDASVQTDFESSDEEEDELSDKEGDGVNESMENDLQDLSSNTEMEYESMDDEAAAVPEEIRDNDVKKEEGLGDETKKHESIESVIKIGQAEGSKPERTVGESIVEADTTVENIGLAEKDEVKAGSIEKLKERLKMESFKEMSEDETDDSELDEEINNLYTEIDTIRKVVSPKAEPEAAKKPEEQLLKCTMCLKDSLMKPVELLKHLSTGHFSKQLFARCTPLHLLLLLFYCSSLFILSPYCSFLLTQHLQVPPAAGAALHPLPGGEEGEGLHHDQVGGLDG